MSIFVVITMDVRIIKASACDIMVIHDMADVVFRHTYKDILSSEQIDYMMDWMYSPENLCRQMEDGHIYYIALRQERPCGYVSIQPDGVSDDGCKLFHLQKIYVLPSEQGAGLGRILFDKAVESARESAGGHGARIELNVNRSNPSIGFYRHLGMKVLREGDFPIGNGFYMNDYIMGMDI